MALGYPAGASNSIPPSISGLLDLSLSPPLGNGEGGNVSAGFSRYAVDAVQYYISQGPSSAVGQGWYCFTIRVYSIEGQVDDVVQCQVIPVEEIVVEEELEYCGVFCEPRPQLNLTPNTFITNVFTKRHNILFKVMLGLTCNFCLVRGKQQTDTGFWVIINNIGWL